MEAIIKANKNLTDSNIHNDWEMMGKDIKRLQELINSLEVVKQEEDKKKVDADKDKGTNSKEEWYKYNWIKKTKKSTINKGGFLCG